MKRVAAREKEVNAALAAAEIKLQGLAEAEARAGAAEAGRREAVDKLGAESERAVVLQQQLAEVTRGQSVVHGRKSQFGLAGALVSCV